MIITRKNKEGFIYAYFEWGIVDYKGKRDHNGSFMCVKDIWVHKSYDGRKVIPSFIDELDKDPRNQSVAWIYWERQGREKKLSKSFRRSTCLKRILWNTNKQEAV